MRLITTCLLATALAACSDGGADADGDGSITAAEAAREAAGGPDIRMQPGQWEQTVSFVDVDMPGAPAGMKEMMRKNMTAEVTSNICLDAADVEPDANFFAGKGNGDCTYSTFDRSGSHMTMKMTCTAEDGAASEVAMEGDFTPTAYTFDLDTTVPGGPAGPMRMKGKVTAKRLGECQG